MPEWDIGAERHGHHPIAGFRGYLFAGGQRSYRSGHVVTLMDEDAPERFHAVGLRMAFNHMAFSHPCAQPPEASTAMMRRSVAFSG